MPKSTYIAILRGINVSGKNMVKMPALAAMFEQEGFENCRTYIQSGNVLFTFEETDEQELAAQITDAIANAFGYDVPVIVLKVDTMQSVFDKNPFLKAQKEDIADLYVTFLSESPALELVEKIDAQKYQPDQFVLEGNTIYIHCPQGYGRTKLNNNFFESKLKVAATTRNWKTVAELVRQGNELASQH
ncbi:hypothetical protein DYBT9623_00606 [Dyadobacter sp. CECT 9623]|uniref:DUF1697 domain-containing protein n=1 Tax=Dyadobacter linearis TaxID=2823330 RepID=A0ABM8UKD3_9BACT|nr:DUF1697 domain-containing protein [Dyadobacter sp. CECT 9623]CAG5067879.1 hypothetical protein DYBT9623_00606 [Dyadobacter sp. CECT 9623]